MTLQKQPLDISFAQGVDQKSDPKRISPGKFLELRNSVFTKAGLLSKRNGFGDLTELPDSSSTFLTTFNGNLTAVSDSILAYSQSSDTWISKGGIKPIDLSVMPLIRSNLNQTQADSAVSDNGLVCSAYTEVNGGTTTIKYVIADSVTGQNIIAPQDIPIASGAVSGSPRVFLLSNYFIIAFTNVITATSHLQFIAISVSNPTVVTAAADIASSYIPTNSLSWDGVVVGSNLYLAYNTTTGGQSIKVTYLTSSLVVATPVTFAGAKSTMMSLSADNTTPSTPLIYVNYYNVTSTLVHTLIVDQSLNTVLSPTAGTNLGALTNLTSVASSGVGHLYVEVINAYSYDASISSNYVATISCTQAGAVSSSSIVIRSVGLASKAFMVDSETYMLTAYSSGYQPTYFLVNGSGMILAKLAYANGGGYLTAGLPNVSIIGSIAKIPYLIKDMVEATNKSQGLVAAAAPPVYSQLGINLASFHIGVSNILAAEIGGNLNLTGGFIWAYDGYLPVEQGFHLWPDSIKVTTSAIGGLLVAQEYFYVVTYEWSDNQGNVFRSAPSIPVSVTTTGTTSSNTISVPTLRLTAKTANRVKLCVYRWSTAQQTYYQVTSITSPTLNDTAIDSINVTDVLADTAIIGNNILYTTGGVLENIGAPAASNVTLFNDRLFYILAENRNLLGFSKAIIEGTPVELSDLLTLYVAPSIGAQGPTGPMTAISAMDDKLIIFKKNAINYISGTGPDNTGANSQYSDAVFITSVIGCENQASIVFIPNGLMFQSDKGIWLLERNLSTSYIGSPVEGFTSGGTVVSALTIPGTTQVRFTLDSGVTLMYDYFYGQWGTFENVPGISSTLYNDLHTYLNDNGKVFQETPGEYLDGSAPVLISFKTGWMNLAGFQGFQRFYQMFLNGDYLTPFNLYCQFAYDFSENPSQAVRVIPTNVPSNWGNEALWGNGTPWGGTPKSFEARVFPEVQKCESFQVIINEIYDPSFSVAAGAGLTLSGISLVVGLKKGYRTQSSSQSFG